MKKLPSIYKNDNTNFIDNNTKSCKVISIEEMDNTGDINSAIDDIFKSSYYAFNTPVIIKTKYDTYETGIVSKKDGYILTLDNMKIEIDDILSIQRKNP